MTIKFGLDDSFHRDVRARVDRYFRMTRRRPRDVPQMYVKSGIMMLWLLASYVLLVFFAGPWWLAGIAAISLALAITAVGFNVQHDGGHKAYSKYPWINRWTARSLDLIGGSSFLWDHKHNSLHHTYANIEGHDDDIDVGIFGRFAPDQQRYWFHRVQHLYMWALYALLPLKWVFFDDFKNVWRGRIGSHRFARPKGFDLFVFIGGKAIFFTLAFVIPMLLHPWWAVLAVYIFIAGFHGVIMSVVFQLAHVVESAEFPSPAMEQARMDHHWAEHQVLTTVDFSPRNRIVTWYMGGLNYQIEHHLFPRICHLHYPKLSRIVKRSCQRHGLKYNVHPSLWGGIVSHFKWLRQMGRPARA